jgi:hypothetical protein
MNKLQISMKYSRLIKAAVKQAGGVQSAYRF